MSQVVFANVIRRFTTMYGAPNVLDKDAFFDEFCKALRGYSPEILDKATTLVIAGHVYPSWPTVGELVKAARSCAEDMRQPAPTKPEVWPPPTPEQKARADAQQRQMTLSAVGNTFVDIQRRCPRDGSINVAAPWGEEVRDRGGNIIPIRKRLAGGGAP